VAGQPLTDGGVQLSQGIDIISVAAQLVELRVVIGSCPSGRRPVTMASVGASRRDSAGRNGFTSSAPTVVERLLPVYGIVSLPSVPPWSTTVSPLMVRENSS
jgi:hypothetical protein